MDEFKNISRAGWRAIFYMNTGVAALTFIGAFIVIDPDLPSTKVDRWVD